MSKVRRVLISAKKISKRVRALAKQIEKEYVDENPVLICVLKGSVPFFADLIRNMNCSLAVDFIGVSSYGEGTSSSGQVTLTKDLTMDIAGRRVLIVEDIIDSGNTLFALMKLLAQRNPKSVEIVTLLDKPARRVAPVQPAYVGFVIEDEFVIGYGLDYAEEYRNLPYVGILAE